MAYAWIRLIGMGVLGAVLAMLLQRMRGEYAAAVRIAVGLACAVGVLYLLRDGVSELCETADRLGVWEYADVLLRGLGVAFLTQFCVGVCRDCGEQGIGVWVEIAGKCEILTLCFPLLRQILEAAEGILSLT